MGAGFEIDGALNYREEEKHYASHGHRKSEQGIRGRGATGSGASYSNGEIQRATREGRDHARGRWVAAHLERQASPVLWIEAHRHRRPVHREQGTDRRLLDLAGTLYGRSRGVAEAL